MSYQRQRQFARWVSVKQLAVIARVLLSMDDTIDEVTAVDFKDPDQCLAWGRRCFLREIVLNSKPDYPWYQHRLDLTISQEPKPSSDVEDEEKMSQDRDRFCKALLRLIDDLLVREVSLKLIMANLWVYFVSSSSTNLWLHTNLCDSHLWWHWQTMWPSEKTKFFSTLHITNSRTLAIPPRQSLANGKHEIELRRLLTEASEAVTSCMPMIHHVTTLKAPRKLTRANIAHPVCSPSDIDGNEQCPICFTDYALQDPKRPFTNLENNPVQLDGCKHIFCSSCIDTLLDAGNTYTKCCPTCRTPFGETEVALLAKKLFGTIMRNNHFADRESFGRKLLAQIKDYTKAAFATFGAENIIYPGHQLKQVLGSAVAIQGWLNCERVTYSEDLHELYWSAAQEALNTLLAASKRYEAFLNHDIQSYNAARSETLKHTLLTEQIWFFVEMCAYEDDLDERRMLERKGRSGSRAVGGDCEDGESDGSEEEDRGFSDDDEGDEMEYEYEYESS